MAHPACSGALKFDPSLPFLAMGAATQIFSLCASKPDLCIYQPRAKPRPFKQVVSEGIKSRLRLPLLLWVSTFRGYPGALTIATLSRSCRLSSLAGC